MTSSRILIRVLAALALAAAVAGCNERKDPGFQGWVEADMIFVSPDETGRVTKLNVREGDEVKRGDPLYSVDDDLQQADLNQNKATLANAQQTYDRAASLSKTGSGTQANLDSAVSALRVAEARVNTSQTRLARRNGFAPVERHHPADLFPRRRDGAGAAAGAVDHAARQYEGALLRAGGGIAEAFDRRRGEGRPATIAPPISPRRSISSRRQAEYTPPVIYSLDERNKLVYLIQARPSRPDALRVGQPVSVYLNPKTPVAERR